MSCAIEKYPSELSFPRAQMRSSSDTSDVDNEMEIVIVSCLPVSYELSCFVTAIDMISDLVSKVLESLSNLVLSFPSSGAPSSLDSIS